MSQFNINNKSYLIQFIYLIILVVLCLVFVQALVLLIFLAIGTDLSTLQEMSISNFSEKEINAYKLAQILSTIFMFIVPALIFSWLKTGHRYRYTLADVGINPTKAVLAILSIFLAMPVAGYLMELNQGMSLPASLSELEAAMRAMEDQAEEMIAAFLQMDHLGDLLLNLLMVAVLPAIGEELLFRGSIQRLIEESSKRPHLAIWLSAFLFSFIHFQFYGFFPRMMLGVLLGYLFYWGGSLWYPIIAHFLNNGFQVIAIYFGWIELPEGGLENAESIPIYGVIIGSVLLAACLFQYQKQHALES